MINKASIFLLLIFATGTLSAANITDKLVVGLYENPSTEGDPLRLIDSGTPLEVLSKKNGFQKVRLSDNTEGWVLASYVTDEKPASAMLLDAHAEIRSLRDKLAAAGVDSDKDATPSRGSLPSVREAIVAKALEKAEKKIVDLQAQVDASIAESKAQERAEVLQEAIDKALVVLSEVSLVEEPVVEEVQTSSQDWLAERGLPDWVIWLIPLVALLAGFAAGVAYIDAKIRKRYGGCRI